MKCQACHGSGVEYVGSFYSGPCLKCQGTGEIAHVDEGGPPPRNCGDGVPAGLGGGPVKVRKPKPVKAKPKPKPKPKKKGGR